MPRLSLFHSVTAAAVLTAGATGWLALAGNLAVAVALAGVALLMVAVLQFLADRRSASANRRALGEIRALSNGLGSLSQDLSSLSEKSTLLGNTVTESLDHTRRQAEGAERRLLASVDAARLEAATTRTDVSPAT